MNYGLYLSASGVLTSMHRQDVAANNLANVETVGFKRDLAAVRQRLPEILESGGPTDAAHDLLDRLGGALHVNPTRADLSSGQLDQTNQPLDLAIRGDAFFAVQDSEGVARLTRDGRFTLDAQGRLVSSTTGQGVLDINGQIIRLDPAQSVEVDHTGTVRQGGSLAARIKLVPVSDSAQLRHHGRGLYGAPAALIHNADNATESEILQGYVERSNVDAVRATLEMIEASRSISTNANMIRYHDLMMERAANTLGRVA